MKYKTEVLRTDPQFKEMIRKIQEKKFVQDKRLVKSSRITLAILNQYKKYPDLYTELMRVDLK